MGGEINKMNNDNIMQENGLNKAESTKYAVYTRTVIFRKKDNTASQELRQFQIQKKNQFGEVKAHPAAWFTVGLASEFAVDDLQLFFDALSTQGTLE